MSLHRLERALDRLEDAIESKAADTPDASRSPRGPLAVVASSVPLRGSTADVLLFRSKTDQNNPQPSDGQRFGPTNEIG